MKSAEDEKVQTTEEQRSLQDAIRKLYPVFAKYPLRPDIPYAYCHDEEDNLRLHSKPLVELEQADLEDYTRSALLTWGTDEDFKHFLPRLFEIMPGYVDTPVVFGKLHHAKWRDWPKHEQVAVECYFKALWQYHLSLCIEDPYIIDEILCGIAYAVDDLAPYLDLWRKSGLTGYYRLADFIVMEYDSIAQKHELFDTFWRDKRKIEYDDPWQNDTTPQMNQVIDWLLDPTTKLSLEEAYLMDPSDTKAEVISTAVDILDHLAKLYPQAN